jgi:DNA-3-methyladenine glycosylase II
VILRRVLGVERDISGFHRAARRLPWLRTLAARMRGVKPPRYPTLWEACVNAILSQQVSLAAAASISRRLTLALGSPATSVVAVVHPFPGLDRFRGAHDDDVRAAGVSASKLATSGESPRRCMTAHSTRRHSSACRARGRRRSSARSRESDRGRQR